MCIILISIQWNCSFKDLVNYDDFSAEYRSGQVWGHTPKVDAATRYFGVCYHLDLNAIRFLAILLKGVNIFTNEVPTRSRTGWKPA